MSKTRMSDDVFSSLGEFLKAAVDKRHFCLVVLSDDGSCQALSTLPDEECTKLYQHLADEHGK